MQMRSRRKGKRGLHFCIVQCENGDLGEVRNETFDIKFFFSRFQLKTFCIKHAIVGFDGLEALQEISLNFFDFSETIRNLELINFVQDASDLDILVKIDKLMAVWRRSVVRVAVVDKRHVRQIHTQKWETRSNGILQAVAVLGKVASRVGSFVDGVIERLVLC